MNVRCSKHPKYEAKRRPTSGCDGCEALYAIRWQHTGEAEKRLGSLNPLQWFDTEEAIWLLSAVQSEEEPAKGKGATK